MATGRGGGTGVGRRTKLTPDVQDRITAALEKGHPRYVAARCGGVHFSTFERWLVRGEQSGKAHEIYRTFSDAVLEAENRAEMRGNEAIQAAGELDARHWEWWMERRFPERWGRQDRVRVDVTGSIELAAEIVHGIIVALVEADGLPDDAREVVARIARQQLKLVQGQTPE